VIFGVKPPGTGAHAVTPPLATKKIRQLHKSVTAFFYAIRCCIAIDLITAGFMGSGNAYHNCKHERRNLTL